MPVLAGTRFKPEVYITERNGVNTFGFTPDSLFVTLGGTDRWLDTYWEIPDVKFNGVNQGPQAAARFVLTGKIFVSRVRYGVIRPCGPNADVNPLAACKPPMMAISPGTNGTLRFSWPGAASGYTIQSATTLDSPQWEPVNVTPQDEGNLKVVNLPILPGVAAGFYRLSQGP